MQTPELWDEPPTRGIPDPQQTAPLCRCHYCGGEIYPGNDLLTDTPNAPEAPDAVTIHPDCLMDWVRERGTTAVAEAFGFHRIGGGG